VGSGGEGSGKRREGRMEKGRKAGTPHFCKQVTATGQNEHFTMV